VIIDIRAKLYLMPFDATNIILIKKDLIVVELTTKFKAYLLFAYFEDESTFEVIICIYNDFDDNLTDNR
jgi:hypothetical protein